jgi:hypothetical protein
MTITTRKKFVMPANAGIHHGSFLSRKLEDGFRHAPE